MSTPFSAAQLTALAARFGTPLWVYDAATIRARIAALAAFETVRYAQKACSNLHILQLMRAQGVRVDAVSRGEVLRALAAGYTAGHTAEKCAATRRARLRPKSSSPPTCSTTPRSHAWWRRACR